MSSKAVIVDNLSKKYAVRHRSRERYTALRDVIAREAHNLARNAFDLARGRQLTRADEIEDFWALRDVSFEVKVGDIFAVIGRNGAGKSTLLKILGRITAPNRGRAILYGRVSSLLEVGTGFHPELTGRENIFLNGAILGMRRTEIKARFDEIVAFAEVERFLDTPVKHYSSGMYVRLAFAVAAHLESEILIMDEVLAVGDAEFQRKCLGKMNDVARGGRTVLFVSHDLAAIRSLTRNGVLLNHGSIECCGTSDEVIERYVQLTNREMGVVTKNLGRGRHTAIKELKLIDDNGRMTNIYKPGEPLRLEVVMDTDGTPGMSLEVFLVDASRVRVGLSSLYQFHGQTIPTSEGTYHVKLTLAPVWLASGSYGFDFATSLINNCWDHLVEGALGFEVPFSNALGYPWDFKQSYGYGALTLLANPEPEFVRLEAYEVSR
jgi:lipopolysaccharide transport system ATP-binding protein